METKRHRQRVKQAKSRMRDNITIAILNDFPKATVQEARREATAIINQKFAKHK